MFEERRTVTALFADVVGSTATAEALDVEDVRLRLLRFHNEVRGAIEQHSGVVEKFIGDAVVGLFGVEEAHEDDPVRAVRAALAARDAVAALNADEPWLDLHVRVGVSTGEALVAVGIDRFTEGVVTGDVLNTTARIQSAAPVDGVLVGRRTYDAVRSAIEVRAHDPVDAKGKGEPVEVWEAIAVLGSPVARTDAPFVGRTTELEQLESVWRSVREGPARVVTIAAPAGTGKTRLVVELLRRLDADVLRGRCLAYGEGITYWPLVEALTGVELDADDAVERALAALLGGEPITRGELHWGIRRALELRAARTPTVLVVEDVHWAEPTLLELLASLTEVEAPLLVLATARPDECTVLPGEVVTLAALGDDDALELVLRLLGDDAPRELRQAVVRRAGGNPLFLEETARSVGEAGDLMLPSGVEALIAARLDRLPVGARRLLGAAATVGAVFWEGALARIAPSETGELDRLLEEGLVHRRPASSLGDEDELVFHHELYRDVAYARLPRGVRAEMHVACADWIDERPTALELVEIVASHLERACGLLRESRRPVAAPTERAVAALEASATRAELREGFDEAERYLARALDLLTDESEQRDALSVRRAGLAVSLGRLEEAADSLNVLVADLALAARSPDERARALVWLANVHGKQSRPEEARACLDAALTNDQELLARAAYERSVLMSSFEGDVEGALEELGRGRERAAAAGNDGLALEGKLRAGFHLFDLGRMDEAAEELIGVIEGAEELGRTRDASRARMELAFARRFQGVPDEAEELARSAHEPFVRTGDRYFVAQNLRLMSELAWDRGDDAAAAALAREALGAAVDLRSHTLVLEAQVALVEALVGAGRASDARTVAADAREWLPEGDRFALLIALRMDVLVALAEGEEAEARAVSRRQVEIADELGRPIDRVAARIHLAEVLRRTGEDGDGEVLADAQAIADAGDAPWLARAVEAAVGGRARIPI